MVFKKQLKKHCAGLLHHSADLISMFVKFRSFRKSLLGFFQAGTFTPKALNNNPAGNYIFKVNYRNTRTRYEICLTLTGISHLVVVFLLLTLNM